MRRCTIGTLALLLAALLAACSAPPEPAAAGPQETLEEFYRHLNGSDYASAMALYSAEALEIWEDPAVSSESSFADWAKGETRGGSVARVRVITENVAAESASFDYEVVYADGTTARHTVQLVLEEGGWRLGLIG